MQQNKVKDNLFIFVHFFNLWIYNFKLLGTYKNWRRINKTWFCYSNGRFFKEIDKR